jgi:hypothetical protein
MDGARPINLAANTIDIIVLSLRSIDKMLYIESFEYELVRPSMSGSFFPWFHLELQSRKWRRN